VWVSVQLSYAGQLTDELAARLIPLTPVYPVIPSGFPGDADEDLIALFQQQLGLLPGVEDDDEAA
jgi:hypothetical protein